MYIIVYKKTAKRAWHAVPQMYRQKAEAEMYADMLQAQLKAHKIFVRFVEDLD